MSLHNALRTALAFFALLAIVVTALLLLAPQGGWPAASVDTTFRDWR